MRFRFSLFFLYFFAGRPKYLSIWFLLFLRVSVLVMPSRGGRAERRCHESRTSVYKGNEGVLLVVTRLGAATNAEDYQQCGKFEQKNLAEG